MDTVQAFIVWFWGVTGVADILWGDIWWGAMQLFVTWLLYRLYTTENALKERDRYGS